MSATIKGDNTVLFAGTGTLYATGLISGGTIETTSEELIVPNNSGEDTSVILFNEKKTANIDVIVQTAVPTLAVGDEVTIKAVTGYIVKSFREIFANKDVRKYNFVAVKHVSVTLA